MCTSLKSSALVTDVPTLALSAFVIACPSSVHASLLVNSLEEGDVVDWYEDDEMRRQGEKSAKRRKRLFEEKQKEMVWILRVCKECQSLWFLPVC